MKTNLEIAHEAAERWFKEYERKDAPGLVTLRQIILDSFSEVRKPLVELLNRVDLWFKSQRFNGALMSDVDDTLAKVGKDL